jgi:hypothetical protein
LLRLLLLNVWLSQPQLYKATVASIDQEATQVVLSDDRIIHGLTSLAVAAPAAAERVAATTAAVQGNSGKFRQRSQAGGAVRQPSHSGFDFCWCCCACCC